MPRILTDSRPGSLPEFARGASRLLACACLLLGLAGCATLRYYGQAVNGQMEIVAKEQPISWKLASADTAPPLKARLREIQAIRRYAVTALDLPDNGSYTDYADLGRRYVVWNVVAAPEFSVRPKRFCYLIVGCVSYRGYFALSDALTEARRLSIAGYDVYVGGVPAYSTLGWFDDPVLNTWVGWSLPRVAQLIFHELTHQRLYVNGDTAFDESLATFVSGRGVRQWLAGRGACGALAAWIRETRRETQVRRLLAQTRARLRGLYALKLTPDAMRARKQAVLGAARRRYGAMSESWGRTAPYRGFFAGGLNNAKLALAASYQRWVPAFRELLRRDDGDWERFFADAKALGSLSKRQRQPRLRALAAKGRRLTPWEPACGGGSGKQPGPPRAVTAEIP